MQPGIITPWRTLSTVTTSRRWLWYSVKSRSTNLAACCPNLGKCEVAAPPFAMDFAGSR